MSLDNWKVGQQVQGLYCSVPYSGKLLGGEFGCRNTPDYRNWIFVIQLDQPIMVFGQERRSIQVWSNSKTDTCISLKTSRI